MRHTVERVQKCGPCERSRPCRPMGPRPARRATTPSEHSDQPAGRPPRRGLRALPRRPRLARRPETARPLEWPWQEVFDRGWDEGWEAGHREGTESYRLDCGGTCDI